MATTMDKPASFGVAGGRFDLFTGFTLIFQQVCHSVKNNIQFAGNLTHFQHIKIHAVEKPGMAGKGIGKLTAHFHKRSNIKQCRRQDLVFTFFGQGFKTAQQGDAGIDQSGQLASKMIISSAFTR